MLNALKAVVKEQKNITVDWEVRSRIAQILHDSWSNVVPQAPHNRLAAKGFKYLPRLLSIWAVDNHFDPVPLLLPAIDHSELDDIILRADILKNRGLASDAQAIWNVVAEDDRNVMIAMWLTRDSPARSAIAHPIPTVGQAQVVIDSVISVSNLSVEAKRLAQWAVTFGVDKGGAPMFTQ